ncbi:MAG: VWA domain-containing protein [Candidatus Cloacimonetes bacterium]|nr:VWA domain-containing protein [Candidatus Cloacimonadota bacterium]
MNLANPYLFLLLIICIVLFWFILRRSRRVEKRFLKYAELKFKPHYFQDKSAFWTGFKLFLMVIALAWIIVALVRPQWDYEPKKLESTGIDLVFAIDVSKSMDATDMMPSRLIRALLQINGFLGQVKTDRIGIIAFAGVASLECPLTDDYEAVKVVLGSLNSGTVTIPGTNIGAALELASDAFKAASQANSLILISDGEDLEGDFVARAKELRNKGIRIHTMGVGSPEGSIIKNPLTGQEVVSKLDEKSLQDISRISGGDYYRVTPGGDEVLLILKRIYDTETSRTNSKNISALKEQYYLFALFAIIFLILESFIDVRRKKGSITKPNHQSPKSGEEQ